MKQYYICKPGRTQEGPYPEDMVRTCYEQGIFPAGTLIWFDGAAEWIPIQSVFATSGRASSMPSAPESSVPEPEPSAASADISLQTEPTDSSMPTPQSAMPAAPAVTVATPPPYMTTPYPVPPPPPQEEAVYYVTQPGMQPQGPYTRTAAITGYYQGVYPPGTMIWGPDTGTWIPIENILGSALHSGVKSVEGHFQGWANAKSWNPITAFVSCMKRYIQFSGRASRSEYWYFVLVKFLIYIALTLLAIAITEEKAIVKMVQYIGLLPLLLPFLAVQARRLHDRGLKAWWLFLLLLGVFGLIPLFIMSCFPSKKEPNQHGAAPLPPA